jgi:hypothetical protein
MLAEATQLVVAASFLWFGMKYDPNKIPRSLGQQT